MSEEKYAEFTWKATERIVTEPTKPHRKARSIDHIKEVNLDIAVNKIVRCALDQDDGAFWWIAETYQACAPVKELIWKRLIVRCKFEYRSNEHTFRLMNGSSITLRSGGKADYLRGYSLNGVVLSRWVGRETTLSAMTCLTQTQGWALWVRD